MDRLGAITLFTKVVETGSFSAAGRQSNLAPSSVSRRIVELEAWIGASLFHRTTRRLTLTEVGRTFYDRTKGILLDLEEARVVSAQLEEHPSGLIRLTIPSSMENHLTTAMSDFQARWPGVSFSIMFTDHVVDLVAEGFDLAVRIGRMEDSTLKAKKIGEAGRFLCASPSYLARIGAPKHPSELADHNCLTFRTHPGYNVWRFNSDKRKDKATIDVRASGGFSANSGDALITPAKNGMGLVLLPEWLVGPLMASGELVEVLPDFLPDPHRTPLYAIHPYQRFVPPKVRTFVDFLADRFSGDYCWASPPGRHRAP